MKVARLGLAALGLLPLAGCSSSASSASAAVTGTFAGQSLEVNDTAAFSGTAGTGTYVAVVLSSAAGICTVARENARAAGSKRLTLVIEEAGGGAAAQLAAGTYALTGTAPTATGSVPGTAAYEDAGVQGPELLGVGASFDALDSTCAPTLAPTATQATTGTITIASLTASSISGSFSVTFPSGDHLSGHFDSPICDGADPDVALGDPASSGTDTGAAYVADDEAVTCVP